MLEEGLTDGLRVLLCLLRHTELYAIASIRRPLMVSNIEHGIIYLLPVSALLCSVLLCLLWC